MTFQINLQNNLSQGERLFYEPTGELLSNGKKHQISFQLKFLEYGGNLSLFKITVPCSKKQSPESNIEISASDFIANVIDHKFSISKKNPQFKFVQQVLQEVSVTLKSVKSSKESFPDFPFEIQNVVLRENYYENHLSRMAAVSSFKAPSVSFNSQQVSSCFEQAKEELGSAENLPTVPGWLDEAVKEISESDIGSLGDLAADNTLLMPEYDFLLSPYDSRAVTIEKGWPNKGERKTPYSSSHGLPNNPE